MKLPQYYSSAPIPSKTLQGEFQPLPAGFGGAMSRALAQVGQDVQRTAVSIGQDFAEADRRRRALEEATQTAVLTTEAELALKQRAYDVTQGPDYTQYEAEFNKGAREILSTTLSKSQSPAVKSAVTLRLTKKIGDELLDLQVIKQKRYADTQIAGLDQHLKNAENLIGLSQKPEEVGGYIGLGLGHIDALAQAGLITSVDAVKRKEKFLEGISAVKARQDIQRDPAAFVQNADRYVDLDPKTRQSLVEHAGLVAERNDAKAEAERLRAERAAEKAVKEQRDTVTRTLLVGIEEGTIGKKQVLAAAKSGNLDDIQTRSLLRDVEHTQEQRSKGVASDPRALLALTYHVNQVGSGVTDEDIVQAPSISPKDKIALLEKNRARTEGRESQALSALKDEHGQAEQYLRATLGIPTLWDRLDQGTQRAYASAFSDLTEASALYPTLGDPEKKERPLVAAKRIANTYAAVLGEHNRVEANEFLRGLKYKKPDGTPDAGALLANKAKLTPDQYQTQIELLRKYEDARKSEGFFRSSEEKSR
jgi:hypothetical protein